MELWMSGEIQHDVAEAYRKARNLIEDTVNESIKDNDYGEGLRRWSYIAIIRAEDSEDYGEVKKYWKKRKEAEFRLKIDHAAFLSADMAHHIRLISQSLLSCIRMMPEIGVTNFNFDRFNEDVTKCLSRLDSTGAVEV